MFRVLGFWVYYMYDSLHGLGFCMLSGLSFKGLGLGFRV